MHYANAATMEGLLLIPLIVQYFTLALGEKDDNENFDTINAHQ